MSGINIQAAAAATTAEAALGAGAVSVKPSVGGGHTPMMQWEVAACMGSGLGAPLSRGRGPRQEPRDCWARAAA